MSTISFSWKTFKNWVLVNSQYPLLYHQSPSTKRFSKFKITEEHSHLHRNLLGPLELHVIGNSEKEKIK